MEVQLSVKTSSVGLNNDDSWTRHGVRIGGVRLSFWKLVVFVTACIGVVGVLVTALAK